MSDFADVSDQRIAEAIADGISRIRRATALPSIGKCHFCEEAVPDGLLFCDVHCRDDFEKEEAARRRAGRQ